LIGSPYSPARERDGLRAEAPLGLKPRAVYRPFALSRGIHPTADTAIRKLLPFILPARP
jgi:hypothetical protein